MAWIRDRTPPTNHQNTQLRLVDIQPKRYADKPTLDTRHKEHFKSVVPEAVIKGRGK